MSVMTAFWVGVTAFWVSFSITVAVMVSFRRVQEVLAGGWERFVTTAWDDLAPAGGRVTGPVIRGLR
jgi:hypothetical protein